MSHCDMSGTIKAEVRATAVDMPNKMKCKNPVFITTKELRDIKYGLKTGMLNSSTVPILINYDAKEIKGIIRGCSKYFKNFFAIKSRLETIDLDSVLDGEKTNYFFCDLCGYLQAKTSAWLYNNKNSFDNKTRLSITFDLKERINKFNEPVENTMYHGGSVSKNVLELYKNADKIVKRGCKSISDYPKIEANLLMNLTTLYGILSDFNIDLTDVIVYRNKDLSSMSTIMVTFNMMLHRIKIDKKRELKYRNAMRFFNKMTGSNHLGLGLQKRGPKTGVKNNVQKEVIPMLEKYGVSKYKTFELISPAAMAHVTMKANKFEKDSDRIKTRLKAEFTRLKNKSLKNLARE